jgi:hypothetical protein
MFVVEIVEGKDRPLDLGTPEFEGVIGKTGGLLLRMLKSCFNSGRYVVLDSGFCLLKAIVALHEKGMYAGTLIKKRHFWPSLVPGDAIDARFMGKSPGECEAISGTLNSSPYYIWGMNEPDYVMKIMALVECLRKMTLAGRHFMVLATQELDSSTRSHLIGIFAIAMQLTTTTIYVMLCLLWRIPG